MVTKAIVYILLILFVSLPLSLASAQTLVAGRIYNSGYSNTIENANVTVKCNHNSSDIILNTVSLSDGTYAVYFAISECGARDSVEVSANRGSLSGSGNGVISFCEGEDCDSEYLSIINLDIKSSNDVFRGGGGRFYLCGNGKCDSGETATTCAKDCKEENKTEASLPETSSPIEPGYSEETESETAPEESEKGTFFSRITGAVIGTLGLTGAIIAIIFLVILICSVIFAKIIRKRKSHTLLTGK